MTWNLWNDDGVEHAFETNTIVIRIKLYSKFQLDLINFLPTSKFSKLLFSPFETQATDSKASDNKRGKTLKNTGKLTLRTQSAIIAALTYLNCVCGKFSPKNFNGDLMGQPHMVLSTHFYASSSICEKHQ
jgi:hypothetical protein